jgi:hypothetical protein
MGSIDVSELLADPDLVQPLTLIKRTACRDSFGQNQLQETGYPIVGSVQPVSGKTLQRLPEAMRVANVQSFWVKHKLVSDSRDKYPDIIVKNGKRFTVQVVFDWSDWGSGWTEGTCVAERPAG